MCHYNVKDVKFKGILSLIFINYATQASAGVPIEVSRQALVQQIAEFDNSAIFTWIQRLLMFNHRKYE